PDRSFCALLQAATDCELENLAQLGQQVDLFPTHEMGIAQGCCLSPLLGNVLLAGFDAQMNGRGIKCLRYIDDFLLLGESEHRVMRAFESAQRILAAFNMSAYDPRNEREKAQKGETLNGFEFLGCVITRGRVSPNEKSQSRLKDRVRTSLDEARSKWSNPKERDYRYSLVESLFSISKVIQAWGSQYQFANNRKLWEKLDKEIDNLIRKHIQSYGSVRSRLVQQKDSLALRRTLGVFSLLDCKSESIFPLMQSVPPVPL
ncbi:MAG TPA: reverse transcriptase domain-containing protein, partial [Thermoanaerobaculia bacterium]|nr:reverse transcriptase domain-containing protein [Thermoanaerobaculia bacterium]